MKFTFSCRILRNKIGPLRQVSAASPYDLKHAAPPPPFYNALYPAYSAAAYSSITSSAAFTSNANASSISTTAPVKTSITPSPMMGHPCGGGTPIRNPWPSAHSVTDMLGDQGGVRPPAQHHPSMSDACNYNNYYMYHLQSCGAQQAPHPAAALSHNQLTNQLSSTIANGFSSPLIANAFQYPLGSMMGTFNLGHPSQAASLWLRINILVLGVFKRYFLYSLLSPIKEGLDRSTISILPVTMLPVYSVVLWLPPCVTMQEKEYKNQLNHKTHHWYD